MSNIILIISRLWQGSAVDIRSPSRLRAISLSLQSRKASVFLPFISNTAATSHHKHHRHHDDHRLTSPPLQCTVATARRNWQSPGVHMFSSFQFQYINRKQTFCRAFASSEFQGANDHNKNDPPTKKSKQDIGKSKHSSSGQITVSEILDNYMIRHKKLKSYQVAATWNYLGKAVQNSRKWERQNFWINHKASLQTLVDQTIQVADQFNGQSTAKVTHSLVKLLHATNSSFRDEFQSLWNTLLIRTILHIQSDGFNAQDISNLIWAYAKADGIIVDSQLLDAIACKAKLCVNDFAPQGLSNVAWGFATMKHKVPLLFDAIAGAAPLCIHDCIPQTLSNMAWAFATLNHEAPSLFDVIAGTAPLCIHDFKPQELSNIIMAYAKMNHKSTELFDAIALASQKRLVDFKPQELSNTAWAFATMNCEATSLLEAIARAALVQINEFNPQDLSNTAWSFAVFNMEPNSFIHTNSTFAQTLLSTDASKFPVEGLRQLHQFHLWCKEQNKSSWFPDDLSHQCQEAFVSVEAEPSQLQNDIVESLRSLQDVSQVKEEVPTESGYSLDVIVVYQGVCIGMEVDGPSHFIGQSQSPKGNTLLKRRQLQSLENWKLVSIPYWEWNKIDTGSSKERKEKKRRYLQNLFKQVAK